jgi:nicotinamide mononucleotide adenylyltransferase
MNINNDQIAFFPGKFHPPHIGHIITILNFLPKYKKVIIGVSEHMPETAIATPDEIINMLKSFFLNFDGDIEIYKIKGVLVEKKDTIGLPKFDILLSGNKDVLDWAYSMGIECKYTERSTCINGTEVRRLLLNECD